MKNKLFLLTTFLVLSALFLSACEGESVEVTRVVKETVVETVKETVIETVVEKETVIVAGTPEIKEVEVTKEVVKEVEVEKEVVVTATPEPEQAPPTEPQSGGTLNISLGDEFVTFHPYWDVTNGEFRPTFYEAPIRITDDGDFEPWLAESYEVSEDGLTITLNLHEGVMFHNGREMTADDVIWAVDYARDEEYGHHLSDRFQTSTGATKVDDYTVEVNYSEVTHSALDGIARLYIFPEEALDTIETEPVGTGPFMLEEWVPGDHLTAAKFDDYWREGLPYLDAVVVKPIPDPQSRMVNMLAGTIDALWGVPLADKPLMKQTEGINVGVQPAGFSFWAILMNVNEPPFDNTLVRQAMNYAVDREKMKQLAFHNEGEMTVVPYPKTSWGYSEEQDYYTFDLDKAKELLAEAGYPDGFEVPMLVQGTSGVQLDQAQVYQADLAQIGVDVTLEPTELPLYWPKLIGSEFAIVSHGTGSGAVDPSGLWEGAACCRPFRNFFGIVENEEWFPEYEAVITEARSEADQEKRKELNDKALSILMEQGWTMATAWNQMIYAAQDYVHDTRTDMGPFIWLDEAWMSK